VTPDDPNTIHIIIVITYNTTCSIPPNTSPLLFLPGMHHLHTDLIIQNVHNFSLIVKLQMAQHKMYRSKYVVGIALINITNLVIKNIMLEQSDTREQTLWAVCQACYRVVWWVCRETCYSYGLEGKAVAFLWPVKILVVQVKRNPQEFFASKPF